MVFIIVIIFIVVGVILGLNNHPLLGFIIVILGTSILFFYNPVINLYNKIFKK